MLGIRANRKYYWQLNHVVRDVHTNITFKIYDRFVVKINQDKL